MSNSGTNINVGELLRFSNEISKVNNLKIEKELVLHQLALFKTITGLVKTRAKNTINTIFQVDFSIDPCYNSSRSSSSSMLNLSENETLKISVTNVSQAFTFHPKFWSILIQYEEGKVHVWNLQNILKGGGNETFCTQFCPAFNYMKQHRNDGREKIEIYLVFSLQSSDSSYTRSFHIKSMYLDILYFINPGRRPCNSSASTTTSNSHVLFSTTTSTENNNNEALSTQLDNNGYQQNNGGRKYEKEEEESITKKLPPVCRFNLKTDEKLHKTFIQDIFLKDCNFTRGFDVGENPNVDSKSIIETDVMLREPIEYHAYFHEERIKCSKHDDNIISFQCSNPSILQLVKDAIYRRLLKLCETRQIKLKCTGHDQIETFYNTKLKFEALTKSTVSERDAYGELLGIYYELRDCSESMICFAYD